VTVPFVGLTFPTGLGVDGRGDLFVADTGNGRVLELQRGATRQTTLPFAFIGATDPVGLAVDDAGDVFVSDGQNAVLEVPHGGRSQIVLPVSGLEAPEALAVDGHGDVIAANGVYDNVSDGHDYQVVELRPGAKRPVGVAGDRVAQ
jgi:serine/threonine-protein kinase